MEIDVFEQQNIHILLNVYELKYKEKEKKNIVYPLNVIEIL